MSENEPLISVIVPVYNVEKYIHRCVDSIVNQTYKNLEIILVDDGSPDNCPAICDEYIEKDSRVKVIHKKNGGLSSARNAGLDIASGDYIGFVDSDDYIDSYMYQKLLCMLINDAADIAICNYDFVGESGNTLNHNMPIPSGVYSADETLGFLQSLNYGPFVSACNRLFSKKLFDSVHFPEGKLNEDNLTAYQLIYKSNFVSMTSETLYFYVQRAESIMHQEITIDRFADIDAVVEKIEFYKKSNYEKYVSSSELQIIRIYRYLRARILDVPPEQKNSLRNYETLAKSLYKKHFRECSLKDHLFFAFTPFYIFYAKIKDRVQIYNATQK